MVLLQIGLTFLLLVLIGFSLSSLYDDVVVNLLKGFTDAIASRDPALFEGAGLVQNLEYTKNHKLVLTGAGVLVLASIFGYLITRLALTPTRNALESQKQFVGNIAHELRTPLSIIKTNSEVALLEGGISKDVRETLESNVEELDRISGIINNLLSMNRLLRPEQIAFSNIELRAILDRVEASLRPLAERKDIALSVSLSDYQTVWGNVAAIEQVLSNIMKNAINYTPAKGSVSVRVEQNYQNDIEITVTDTGMGIPEKDLGLIFEPFYRGDASRNREVGVGSGLGLAIVSELVKLHKGSIGLESVVGQGTSVQITFPHGRDEKVIGRKSNGISMDFSVGRKEI